MSALLNRDFLIQNLCFMHRLMISSAPLLEFAIPKAHGTLRAYYEQHLGEELGHDEMLLADIKALGVTEIPHYWAAAAAAGSQYYLIAHYHPALLLGYMLVLESNPLSISTLDELEAAHACKLSCIRHHSEHDPAHRADLVKMIHALPDELNAAVRWNEQCVRDILQTEFQRWLNG